MSRDKTATRDRNWELKGAPKHYCNSELRNSKSQLVATQLCGNSEFRLDYQTWPYSESRIVEYPNLN
jgi:hypothetical protein